MIAVRALVITVKTPGTPGGVGGGAPSALPSGGLDSLVLELAAELAPQLRFEHSAEKVVDEVHDGHALAGPRGRDLAGELDPDRPPPPSSST